MEKFLNKLAEDEKLRSEFLKQTTPEEAYKVAKPYIGSMSMEEFAEQMVGLAKLMTKAEKGELSEDALNSVAGGFSLTGFLGKVQEVSDKVAGSKDKIAETTGAVAGAVSGTAAGVQQTWTGIKDLASNIKDGMNK